MSIPPHSGPAPELPSRVSAKRTLEQLREDVFKHVQKTDTCWIWTGPRRSDGYGVKLGFRRRTENAHRVVWELENGRFVPDGMQLDHLCRVRHCVNPAHLEVVTLRENVLRGESMPARQARQTHCNRGHEFKPDNIYRYPGSPNARICEQCYQAGMKRRHQRRSAAAAARTAEWDTKLPGLPKSIRGHTVQRRDGGWFCGCGLHLAERNHGKARHVHRFHRADLWLARPEQQAVVAAWDTQWLAEQKQVAGLRWAAGMAARQTGGQHG